MNAVFTGDMWKRPFLSTSQALLTMYHPRAGTTLPRSLPSTAEIKLVCSCLHESECSDIRICDVEDQPLSFSERCASGLQSPDSSSSRPATGLQGRKDHFVEHLERIGSYTQVGPPNFVLAVKDAILADDVGTTAPRRRRIAGRRLGDSGVQRSSPV